MKRYFYCHWCRFGRTNCLCQKRPQSRLHTFRTRWSQTLLHLRRVCRFIFSGIQRFFQCYYSIEKLKQTVKGTKIFVSGWPKTAVFQNEKWEMVWSQKSTESESFQSNLRRDYPTQCRCLVWRHCAIIEGCGWWKGKYKARRELKVAEISSSLWRYTFLNLCSPPRSVFISPCHLCLSARSGQLM